MKKNNGHPSPKRIGAIRITNKSGLRVWMWHKAEYQTAADVWNAAAEEQKKVK